MIYTTGDSYVVDQQNQFDVWKSRDETERLNGFLTRMAEGVVFVGASADEISKNISYASESLALCGIDTNLITYR